MVDAGSEALKKLVAASWTRISTVFAAWDEDGSGTIDRHEFAKVLNGLRLSVSVEEAHGLFDLLDSDKSGSLDYKELHHALRQGQNIELDAALKDGALGEISADAKNKHALRKDGPQNTASRVLAPIALGPGESMVERLRNALTGSWTRVKDLFAEWDADNSGTVDRDEMYRALALLGLGATRAESDELFNTFDADGSGEVSFDELRKLVRRGASIELDAVLRAGALGAIEVGAANKIAVRKGEAGKRQTGSYLIGSLNVSSGASAEAIMMELYNALAASLSRTIDLFREWDTDGDGCVDKQEFVRAMRMLGLHGPGREVAGMLFDKLDADKSGTIEYAELKEKLMQAKHGGLNGGGGADGGDKPRWYRGPVTMRERLLTSVPCLGSKLLDALKEKDSDEDGAVTQNEFVKAVLLSGPPKGFETEPPDGSSKFNEALRELFTEVLESSGRSPEEPLPIVSVLPRTRALAREVEAGNRRRLDAAGGSIPYAIPVGAARVYTLRDLFTASAKPARVLFEAWDAEAAGEGGALTGTFNREALRRALPALHIGCTKAEADALFDLLDASGSGAIPYAGGLLGGGDRKSGGKKGKGKGGSKKHPQRLISDSMSAAYFLPRVQRAASAGRERPLLTISPRVVSEDPEVAAARAKLDPKASPTNAAEEAEPAEKKASAADAAVVTLPSPPGRGRNSARKPNPPNHRKLHLDGLIGASPPTQTPRTGKKKTPRSKRTKEAAAAASSGVEAQQASTPAAAVIDVGDADEGAAAPTSSSAAAPRIPKPSPRPKDTAPSAPAQIDNGPWVPGGRRKVLVPVSPRTARLQREQQPETVVRPTQQPLPAESDEQRKARMAAAARVKTVKQKAELDKATARIRELEQMVANLSPAEVVVTPSPQVAELLSESPA